MSRIAVLSATAILMITVSITLFVINATNDWGGIWILLPIVLLLFGIWGLYKAIDWAKEQDENNERKWDELIGELKGFRNDFNSK